jgi:hypothetical protein
VASWVPLIKPPLLCEVHPQLEKMLRKTINLSKKDAQTLKIHRGFIALCLKGGHETARVAWLHGCTCPLWRKSTKRYCVGLGFAVWCIHSKHSGNVAAAKGIRVR